MFAELSTLSIASACLAAGVLAILLLRRWPQSGPRALLASGLCGAGVALSIVFC